MKSRIALVTVIALAIAAALPADNAAEFDLVFKRMAERIAAVEKKLPNKTVAGYGFQVIGRPDDPYALYATEKITHELVNSGGLLVIERSRIDEILKEQDFAHSAVVDAGTAARIGKILSVDAVIAGTSLVTESRTEFIVRVIQSEKGIILASVDDHVTYTVTAEKAGTDKPASSPSAAAAKATTGAASANGVSLSASKPAYAAGEAIVVSFSGLAGDDTDWLTLVEADRSDGEYGEYFYTDGASSGTATFAGVPAGDWELRLYFDWPAGGYEVQKRLKITVK